MSAPISLLTAEREVFGLLIRMETESELMKAWRTARIAGHEVAVKIELAAHGVSRAYWRLDGERIAGHRILRFLLDETARQALAA